MTHIRIDDEGMQELAKSPTRRIDNLISAMDNFPGGANGGLASRKIAAVLRITLEASQLSAATSTALLAVARAAIEDHTLAEEQIIRDLSVLVRGGDSL